MFTVCFILRQKKEKKKVFILDYSNEATWDRGKESYQCVRVVETTVMSTY